MASKKLIAEVIDARNLIPKDGHGSSSPYVQIDFNGQRKKTKTVLKDLNPAWHERLEFSLSESLSAADDEPTEVDLHHEFLEAHVFCDSKTRNNKRTRHFLGRVKVLGSSFVKKGEEAIIYYHLQKKGWLSSLLFPVRGELGLRVYYTEDDDEPAAARLEASHPKFEAPAKKKQVAPKMEPTPQEAEQPQPQPRPAPHSQPPEGDATEQEALPKLDDNAQAASNVETSGPTVLPNPPAENKNTTNEGKSSQTVEVAPPNVEAKPELHNSEEPTSSSSVSPPESTQEAAPNTEETPPKVEKAPQKEGQSPTPEQQPACLAQEPKPEPPLPSPPAEQAPPATSSATTPSPATDVDATKTRSPRADRNTARFGSPTYSASSSPPPAIVTESDFSLKDTNPYLGGDRSYKYDLVEQMRYLFVRVVKAHSLESSAQPYVRLVFGSRVARTKALSDTHPVQWNQVFAFAQDAQVQSGLLEVSVWSDSMNHRFQGVVFFDLAEVPMRTPPDSPLAPQWYRLAQKHGELGKVQGEIMLAVWIGTQADEAFVDAWQSDTGGHVATTRGKVYLSPKLWYLRVTVIEAHDLRAKSEAGKHELPNVSVKAQLGFQVVRTRVAKMKSVSPFWNEDILLVASEPLDDVIVFSIEDHRKSNRHEALGSARVHLDTVERRVDDRLVATRWLDMQGSLDAAPPTKFQGRLHVRMCFDGGYHVMEETTQLSSDLRPSAKQLWKSPVGALELGILGARDLLPMKTRDGRGATDAYCVAKYGSKWVRTRTVLDSFSPRWNEQYTWEVYDPCTVLTVCVFDNGEADQNAESGMPRQHSRIGKVRVRLSTLEVNRVYTVAYPLLVLQPGSLKKMGEMEVAIRFSCVAMFNLLHMYTIPMLPRMHYLHPISIHQQEVLRGGVMKMVAMRLSRAEPPLSPEVVQYMLDSESGNFSMRKSKANWLRITSILRRVCGMSTWLQDIRMWKNPMTTMLVHVLFLILLCYPELILPTIFFYVFLIGVWRYRWRSRSPPHMDPRLSHADTVDLDDMDEEFDTVPTSKPPTVVMSRYERLRGVGGRVQMVLGDVATQAERIHGLMAWRDPRATALFVGFCLLTAVVLYVAPLRLVGLLMGLHYLRHPRFRSPLPCTFLNFFRRLPAQSDRIL